MASLNVEPTGEATFVCDKCGFSGRRVWGEVLDVSECTLAVYYVSWVGECQGDLPRFDLIIGGWGEGTGPADRRVATVEFNVVDSGPAFRVIDADEHSYSSLAATALRRDDIVNQPQAEKTFDILDAIWRGDARVHDMYQDVLSRVHRE